MNRRQKSEDEDYYRLCENIWRDYQNEIIDEESFNHAYDDYMKHSSLSSDKKCKVRKKAWKHLLTTKGISASKRRQLAEKKVIPKKERAIKRTIIRGLGKKMPYRTVKVVNKKVVERDFNVLGKQKGRTTYAREIKTKYGVAYVDELGRRVKKL